VKKSLSPPAVAEQQSITSTPERSGSALRVLDLGLIGHAEALVLQEEAAQRILEGGEESLFLLEHPPLITFGRNGGKENLPLSADYFTARGVAIVHTDRGGNITCHFPGQLVAYPVMSLNRRPGGLRAFFADLEESIIRTLAVYGLIAGRRAGRPGVWINTKPREGQPGGSEGLWDGPPKDPAGDLHARQAEDMGGDRKICQIGIAVKHRISRHGLSLNVGPDLSLFELIRPCGLPGVRATSLSRELGVNTPSMADVKKTFVREFCALFNVNLL
jgi:lipoyl(octanoyl) transferase